MPILLLALSCEEKYETYENRISSIMGDDIRKYKQITVIPGEGCGGCISGATYFIKENIDKISSVAIIFTGVQDKKLLRHQLGSEFLIKKQVYIDDNNTLMNKEVLSIYPYIMEIEGTSLTSKINFSEELIKTD